MAKMGQKTPENVENLWVKALVKDT